MGRYCTNCGTKLRLFAGLRAETLCKGCRAAYKQQLSATEGEIARTKSCTSEQLELLAKHERGWLLRFYARIYDLFEADKELEEEEIDTLRRMQRAFGLTDDEIRYDERIRPYIYVDAIRKKGALPSIDVPAVPGSRVILRKGETVHLAETAALREVKSVSLGYRGGSHGVSFRVAKGVRYRVGSHRGQIVKQERLLETSRGILMVTNQRLFLHPLPGHKPVNIPLNKILSYQCFDDGIAVYKEGKEKPYIFATGKTVEVFGLCLGHLLKQ